MYEKLWVFRIILFGTVDIEAEKIGIEVNGFYYDFHGRKFNCLCNFKTQ
jgi:hypothetical protein